jgi:hypothetical protein
MLPILTQRCASGTGIHSVAAQKRNLADARTGPGFTPLGISLNELLVCFR